jgi:hypothetical protein
MPTYVRDSGVWKLVSGGPPAASGSTFDIGTRLMFAQATAPTGWTRVTDDSANNRMLRVVSSGGGGTGGSASPILNNVVPSHTHSFTTGGFNNDINHLHGGNTGFVSSDHQHDVVIEFDQSGGAGFPKPTPGGTRYPATTIRSNGILQNHFHGFVTGPADRDLNHTHSGSTDNGSSQTNWAPRYIDMILCSKN